MRSASAGTIRFEPASDPSSEDCPEPAVTRRPSKLDVPSALLAALLTAGVAVRAVACLALWPAALTLSDAANYAADAASNPFTDPQHPAGYPALLAAVGLVTRDVAVTILLQHALGIATALLLFATVRRLTGSPWPALLPAAVVLLDADEIFLEHNVMSEGPFLFVLALGLYAVVRCLDGRSRTGWRWSAVAGLAIGAATITRTAAAFAIPVFVVAIGMARPIGRGRPIARWRASAVFLSVAALVLAAYAFIDLQENGRFEIAPATGWHLYARVAPFADCRRFTPPDGTRGLCESSAVGWRWGPDFYLYAARSPAKRLFAHIGTQDGKVGAFALQVAVHQPADLAQAVWDDMRRYFIPSWRPHGWFAWYKGWDIQPQLDWRRVGDRAYTRGTQAAIAKFFDRFTPQRNETLMGFMHDYQRVFGFGAALLSVCTALTLLGLCVGSRRERAGVLLFGVGGLAQLTGATIGALYMGRYMVPVAGLAAAGAAISGWSLVRAGACRRAKASRWVDRARPETPAAP
jgi:hypothetical protein